MAEAGTGMILTLRGIWIPSKYIMTNFNQYRQQQLDPWNNDDWGTSQAPDSQNVWADDGWGNSGEQSKADSSSESWGGGWGGESTGSSWSSWEQQESQQPARPDSLSVWGDNDWEHPVERSTENAYAEWGYEQSSKQGIARKLIDALKNKFTSPEVQDAAKQVVSDYGKVALMGALDSSGIMKNGRIRKRGVLKAIFMPKRKARQAAMGAFSEVRGQFRSDTQAVRSNLETRLTQEAEKKYGKIGGIVVGRLVQYSPI